MSNWLSIVAVVDIGLLGCALVLLSVIHDYFDRAPSADLSPPSDPSLEMQALQMAVKAGTYTFRQE